MRIKDKSNFAISLDTPIIDIDHFLEVHNDRKKLEKFAFDEKYAQFLHAMYQRNEKFK